MAKSHMHIFRAGQQTTRAGESLAFSEADLANSAKAYDPAKHEAPICIGHPKNDMPAYGWVKSLQASGSDLHAERHQVDPEFAEMARAGRFKKVSAAFYPPDSPSNPVPGVWYLRHVAMLGAEPPAVKGLKPVEFSEADGAVEFAEVEFSDPAFGYIARMFRGLRDYLIETVGLEKTDQVLPDWGISSVEELGRDRTNPANPSLGTAFSEATNPNPETTMEPTQREKELQAQLDTANAQLKANTEAKAKEARDARTAAATEFAEGLISSNQLLPAQKDLVVSTLVALEGDTPVEFSEGEIKKPAGAGLRELLGKLPKHSLDNKHLATNHTASQAHLDDVSAIVSKAAEFQEAEGKAGRHVSIDQAVQHVTRQA